MATSAARRAVRGVVARGLAATGRRAPLARCASTTPTLSPDVPTASGHTLTPADVAKFREEGFLVVPEFIERGTCERLKRRAEELVAGFDASVVSVFSTDEQTRTSDAYFLDSGDKISFFFEEGAFDEAGALVREKDKAINKIGHALHDRDDLFREVSYDPRLAAMCRALDYTLPLLTQTMYIFKQPGIGGVVGPHQDGTFLYTQPQSVTGFWFAMEDCTVDNGCLWAVPRSHMDGVPRRFMRDASGSGTAFDPPEPVTLPTEGAQCLEVPAGTLVLLHSANVHFSHANKSALSRHAYTIHVVEGAKGVTYPADNWLQRPPEDPFRTFRAFADAAEAAGVRVS